MTAPRGTQEYTASGAPGARGRDGPGRRGGHLRADPEDGRDERKNDPAQAAKEAEKQRKARESEKLGREAEAESAKIRQRFDAERQALARRYGVITGLS